jgi:hypothetical protein
MIERVKHISADPLSAIHEEEERLLIEELCQSNKNKKKDQQDSDDVDLDEEEAKEKSIKKRK